MNCEVTHAPTAAGRSPKKPIAIRLLAIGSLVAVWLFVVWGSAWAATPTMCTVTINSSNERRALRAAFPDSRFVELTDYGQAGDPAGWLSEACAARVHCDVLLISGHFANTFFGDTAFELSLRALERLACQRTCDTLLSPRVVFLFGCNTLAGKDLDRRTPARYRQVLVEDGLSPEFADRVAALRYGPLGRETRARIRQVFSRDTLLLGFSSVGPVGSVAGPAFRRFLHDARLPLATLLSGSSGRAGDAVAGAWRRTFGGAHPDAARGGTPFTADECLLTDTEQPRLERLLGAERLLSEDPLRYAFVTWDFLQSQSEWRQAETAVLGRLKANPRARHALLAALPRLAGSLDTYFSMLRFARFLGWVDAGEFDRLQAARLDRVFRDGVTTSERDFLCESRLTFAPSNDQLARNRGSVRFIEALSCLSARTPSARAFLLSHLDHGVWRVRLAAVESLTALSLLEPVDVGRLRRLFHASRGELRASVLWALGASDGASPEVQRFIAAASTDADEDVAWTSTQVARHLNVADPVALRSLAGAVSRPEGFVRRAAALALASLAPRHATAADLLRAHVDDLDKVVRTAARSAATATGQDATAPIPGDDGGV